jgi:hypothetical protein
LLHGLLFALLLSGSYTGARFISARKRVARHTARPSPARPAGGASYRCIHGIVKKATFHLISARVSSHHQKPLLISGFA